MNLIEDLYQAWNRHDTATVLDFFTADVRYHDQGMGVTFDRAGLEAFVSASFTAIPDLAFEVTSVQVTADAFAAEAVMTGTQQQELPGLPVTGRPFTVYYALVGDIRDGRISRLVDYWSLPEYAAERPPAAPPARPSARLS